MAVSTFDELVAHFGHYIEVVKYYDTKTGDVSNVAVECEDCHVVLLDFDNHNM